MSNIQPYIILNDIDSRTISGLLISSLPPISKPQVRTQVETVDGRDGDLVTPLGFSAYDKVINIGLTYNYDVDEIIEFFNSEGIVTFSNEPDKFYRYAIYEQIDFDKLIRFKKAEVTLHCQPFKFSTTEDPKLFNVVSGQPITVKNNGNIYSRPDITVIGSGEVDLSLNGSQILSLELADNQAVIIDSEDMNAYAAQSAIREVVAAVDPIQDLHGYSKPWIGGGGKNKAHVTATSQTINEVAYTVATDGRVKANGTADGTSILDLGTITLTGGTTYILSGCPSGGSGLTYCLFLRGSGSFTQKLDFGSGVSFTVDDTITTTLSMIVYNGYNINNLIFEPMVRLSNTSADFEPYENICDISGYNAAIVSRCGINLWNEVVKQGYTITGAGVETQATNAWCSQDYIPLLPNTTYYLKSSSYLNARWYDANKNYLGYSVLAANSTFNSTSAFANARYLRFNGYGTSYNNDISINYPSTDTAYHKHIGSKYQSYFEGLLNGTYGFVDLGTLTFGVSTNNRFIASIDNLYSSPDNNTLPRAIISSNKYLPKTGNNYVSADYSFYIQTNGTLAIRDIDYSSSTDFTNSLDGVYLIYELASVTTPTITQNDIDMLISKFNADLVCVVFDQTVYGGSLNVTTGELTIDKVAVDLGSLTWSYITSGNFPRFQAPISILGKGCADNTQIADIICEIYGVNSWINITNVASYDGYLAENANGGFITVHDSNYASVSDFVSAVSGKKIVYEVATPTEIQLTPTQVNNLLGVNTLYADTNGDITVSHKSNGVIVTNTGAIVSFTVAVDDMEKGALLNRLVTGDYDKIRLKKGDNTIVLTGNAQQFVIDKYSRWI